MRWSPWSATRRGRADDGAAAVEFAIVSGLLFLLLFGIIGLGIVFAQGLAISNAARQAARTGAVSGSGTCLDIVDEARRATTTIALDTDDLTVVASFSGGPNLCPANASNPIVQGLEPCALPGGGEELEVEVTYEASLNLPLVGSFDPFLTRKGFYRCEFSEPTP